MNGYCGDWVEINDGTSIQRYCGCSSCDSYYICSCSSIPGTVSGTTITVKLYTNEAHTESGFFAVVTGDVTVTTDVTCESGVSKYIIEVIINNVSHHHDTFPCTHHHTTSSHHHPQWQH